jgi:uncharacterized protein
MPFGSDADVDFLLSQKTWAIVGLSSNRNRAAYSVAQILQQAGHRIIPVHPRAEEVHGEKGYQKLADIPEEIDVVDVFVNSSRAGEIAEQARLIDAKGIWFQLGVIDHQAFEAAQQAGITMVMDRCPAIELRTR